PHTCAERSSHHRLPLHDALPICRILARAPVVHGMVRWGDDLQQLTVRYGVPYSRTRTASTMTRESSIIEHFDPNQLADVPEDLLTRGPPPPPPPGETWALANPRARSGDRKSTRLNSSHVKISDAA